MTARDMTRHGVTPRVRHLRLALAASGVLAVLGAIVGLVWQGGAGALGVVAGVALVAASYTASTLAIAWADSVNPRMVFPVGMAMYVTKFSLFGALLIFVGATGWPGKIPMAMGIVAGVVVWTGAQIWWTVHHEHPYVGPANPIGDPPPR
jgi:hypothetical protein